MDEELYRVTLKLSFDGARPGLPCTNHPFEVIKLSSVQCCLSGSDSVLQYCFC